MSERDLETQEKREATTEGESTAPAKVYVPPTDIYETADALRIVMDMPGVDRSRLEVQLESNRLTITGEIDFDAYRGLEPTYTEYNVGNFRRAFTLSSKIDRDGITAEIDDGVLTLNLPKAAEVQPRKIEVT